MRACLAHYAAAIQPAVRPVKAQQETELDALMGRRSQLSDMLTAEKNRRGSAATQTTRDDIEEHIEWLEERLKELDDKLKDQLKLRRLATERPDPPECKRHRLCDLRVAVGRLPGIGPT